MTTPAPLTGEDREALQAIAATAVLMEPAIAVSLLTEGLKRTLAEIKRLEGAQDDNLVCCPDCGHWAVSHYTGYGVKIGCALCLCPLSLYLAGGQPPPQPAPMVAPPAEITSSVTEG